MAAALISIPLVSSKRLLAISRTAFDRTVTFAMIGSRLGIFFLVFKVLRIEPRGDIPLYYIVQARYVLSHFIPYRDFFSAYAPLHPYLDAGLLRIWNTQLSIMLFSVLVELLVLFLWLRIGRIILAEKDLRLAALFYLASPISLQYVAIDGQDNVVIAVLMAVSLLLILGRRELLSGLAFGVSICAIKFLPLLYVPGFFLCAARRWRWTAAATAISALTYGVFLFHLHAPILYQVEAEGEFHSSGDLPYLVSMVFGVQLPNRLWDLILLLVLLSIITLMARAVWQQPMVVRARAVSFGMAALTLGFVLFSKKSWPAYLMMALLPICLLPFASLAGRPLGRMAAWMRITAFCLFEMVAVIEHSIWSTIFDLGSAVFLHRLLLSRNPLALVFLIFEVLLISGYIWLLWESIRQIIAAPAYQSLPLVEIATASAVVS